MRLTALATIILSTLILAGYAHLSEAAVISRLPPPNILFVIMDDVGIDQMPSFGYGGGTAAPMPNMDQIAKAVQTTGIRANLVWAVFGHEGEKKLDQTVDFINRWQGFYSLLGMSINRR